MLFGMEATFEARVARVVEKLERARTLGLECFGWESHRFALRSPLSEADAAAFERAQGIALPPELRTFLTHAGDGGAGPYYGLYPLASWSDFAGWIHDTVPTGWLRNECPLVPGSNRIDADAHHSLIPSPYQGTISIGTRGCSYVTLLIVSGLYRGRVVYADADGGGAYVSREPDFLSWYERWLDELLAGWASDWFGYGPGGGPSDWLAILADPSADAELRGEAAHAFSRLPSLDPESRPELQRYLSDSVAQVRAGVTSAAGRFRMVEAGPEIAALLSDESDQVRAQALRVLMSLDAQRWMDAVLPRILDFELGHRDVRLLRRRAERSNGRRAPPTHRRRGARGRRALAGRLQDGLGTARRRSPPAPRR